MYNILSKTGLLTRVLLLSMLVFCMPQRVWAKAPSEVSVDFISIARAEANVRAGPGTQYPILWVYKQKGYPLEVLAKYQGWYKTRDAEGEEGWLYKSLVSLKHTVMVSAGDPIKFYKNSNGSKPMYLLAPRVILTLDECTDTMCKVSYKKTTGWVEKGRLNMLEKAE